MKLSLPRQLRFEPGRLVAPIQPRSLLSASDFSVVGTVPLVPNSNGQNTPQTPSHLPARAETV